MKANFKDFFSMFFLYTQQLRLTIKGLNKWLFQIKEMLSKKTMLTKLSESVIRKEVIFELGFS